MNYEITPEIMQLAIRRLAMDLRIDAVNPSCIIAPARGGLIPGVLLSYKLGVPLIPIIWSTRDHPLRGEIPTELLDIVNQYPDQPVVFIDDIVDSGLSIAGITEAVLAVDCNINLVSCAIIHNTRVSPNVRYSYMQIDRDTDKRWFEFWWEKK